MVRIMCKSDPILGYQYLGIEVFDNDVTPKKFVDKGSFKSSIEKRDLKLNKKGRQRETKIIITE